MPEQVPVDDSQFIILKRVGGVPVMGGCKLCEFKFFTQPTLLKDAVGAERYLRQKFFEHKCSALRHDWDRRSQF